ncbi:hypothetical protein QU863_16780, partial [Escherichia coli]|nr:hypothetical protein [Escherichia coli]
ASVLTPRERMGSIGAERLLARIRGESVQYRKSKKKIAQPSRYTAPGLHPASPVRIPSV